MMPMDFGYGPVELPIVPNFRYHLSRIPWVARRAHKEGPMNHSRREPLADAPARCTLEQASYDALAEEYYDAKAHPTCCSLNWLSRLFLGRLIPEPWSTRDAIEIGAGDSCLAAILHARGYALTGLRITDVSDRMLAHSAHWMNCGASLSTCDARSIACPDENISLLVASLGDPYNVPAFWVEACRVLKPGGMALFTMPSFQWAARVREADDTSLSAAEFLLRDGRRVNVPSFIPPLHEQVRLIEGAGFAVTSFESLGADAFDPTEPGSPNIELFDTDVSVWGFKVIRQKVPLSCQRPQGWTIDRKR